MSVDKVGLFYGSSTCYTEMTAEKIQQAWGDKISLHNVGEDSVQLMEDYQFLIVGIPTWDYGELQEDWENIWDELSELDLSHCRIACFGQGDQIGYPQWYQDALGYLHDKLTLAGATMVGYTATSGHTFEESQGLTDDGTQFLGLALDDENQFELSEARLASWLQQLDTEFNG